MSDDAEPYTLPEATNLLALIRLAAMDGYNKTPVSTVDDWVGECKKLMLLLYLAGRREGTYREEHLDAVLGREVVEYARMSHGDLVSAAESQGYGRHALLLKDELWLRDFVIAAAVARHKRNKQTTAPPSAPSG